MSTADPQSEDVLSRNQRRSAAYWDAAEEDAYAQPQSHEMGEQEQENYFKALEELKTHLDRLGETGGPPSQPRQNVREMQRRVAAFSTGADAPLYDPEPEYDTAPRSEEEPLEKRLADLAAHLQTIRRREREKSERKRSEPIIVKLDEGSRDWIDKRFAGLRTRLDEALEFSNAPPMLDRMSVRIDTLERKVDTFIERQEKSGKELLGAIDSRLFGFTEAQAAANRAAPDAIDAKLAHLAESLDSSLNALSAMKEDTQRIAAAAGETIIEKTVELTSQRVQESIHELNPTLRLTALEEDVEECLAETQALGEKNDHLHRALEQGFEDLRKRMNALAEAIRAQASEPASNREERGVEQLAPQQETDGADRIGSKPSDKANEQDEFDGDDLLSATRDAIETVTAEHWEIPKRLREPFAHSYFDDRRTEDADRKMSWFGLAVVFVILLVASFAMLYAQLQGKGFRPPISLSPSVAPAPAATTIIKPAPASDVFLPGTQIILSPPAGV